MPISRIDIKHLNYNTKGAPLSLDIGGRYRHFGKDFVAAAEQLGVDFFTLQETFPNRKTQEFITGPWKDYHGFFARGSKAKASGFKLGNSGLTTLSCAQIIEQDFLPFTKAIGVDAVAQKGILFTRLKLQDKDTGEEILLDVYNLHMQASYRDKKRGSIVREEQMKEVRAFIQGHSGMEHPVLLSGDFNCEEGTPEYLSLVDVDGNLEPDEFKFIDVMRQLHPDAQSKPLKTFGEPGQKNEQKLDHVFFRPGGGWTWDIQASQSDVIDWHLSDHRGVLTQLSLIQEEDKIAAVVFQD